MTPHTNLHPLDAWDAAQRLARREITAEALLRSCLARIAEREPQVQAFAALDGRDFVTPDDIKRAALPVLRHRVQLTPEIAISGQDVDEVLRAIVESVPAPRQ